MALKGDQINSQRIGLSMPKQNISIQNMLYIAWPNPRRISNISDWILPLSQILCIQDSTVPSNFFNCSPYQLILSPSILLTKHETQALSLISPFPLLSVFNPLPSPIASLCILPELCYSISLFLAKRTTFELLHTSNICYLDYCNLLVPDLLSPHPKTDSINRITNFSWSDHVIVFPKSWHQFLIPFQIQQKCIVCTFIVI